ncbi:hypothetical protein NC652_012681 [Populus alba x Populus x berolinensis]|nr:hypothetical protein NC652_012681 [Populus alba x Populus x berolinensis]
MGPKPQKQTFPCEWTFRTGQWNFAQTVNILEAPQATKRGSENYIGQDGVDLEMNLNGSRSIIDDDILDDMAERTLKRRGMVMCATVQLVSMCFIMVVLLVLKNDCLLSEVGAWCFQIQCCVM